MKVGEQIVRLAVGGDLADDDLAGAAVVKLQAIGAVGLQPFTLLRRQVQMAGENPVLGAGFLDFRLQFDMDVPEPLAADQQIAIDFMHGFALCKELVPTLGVGTQVRPLCGHACQPGRGAARLPFPRRTVGTTTKLTATMPAR